MSADDPIDGAPKEQRASRRHRVLKAGTMAFNGGGISCVVRNLSANGAALDVTSPLGIPDAFKLIMEQDQIAHQCRVVWRSERRIGVVFDPQG